MTRQCSFDLFYYPQDFITFTVTLFLLIHEFYTFQKVASTLCLCDNDILTNNFFFVLQAMEIALLLIEYFWVSCNQMLCVWLVVSHLQHTTHVRTSPRIWSQTQGVLERQLPQNPIILAMARQIAQVQGKIAEYLPSWDAQTVSHFTLMVQKRENLNEILNLHAGQK